ncbi:50S ribosomal protein L10 [Candidatus Peregrinibacteria bacterium]|nr:MAG: 50S ribosomal protein L10 [Candidatus Peregrinibacteria bacterium]
MAVTKQQKEDILTGLIDQFSRSKTVVFTGYRGLDVAGMSDLRRKLRATGSEVSVAKKTLMRIAAEKNDIHGLTREMMEGPVAATFSYEDELEGLKVLFNFAKQNDKLILLGGVVDGRVVGEEEIKKLAMLPGKNELIAKLMGSMNAPISNTVGLLGNLIASFVRVVNAYKDTLPAEGQKEAPAAPAVAEEVAAPQEVAAEEAPAEEVKAEENTEA